MLFKCVSQRTISKLLQIVFTNTKNILQACEQLTFLSANPESLHVCSLELWIIAEDNFTLLTRSLQPDDLR